jgi:hypothetical protein
VIRVVHAGGGAPPAPPEPLDVEVVPEVLVLVLVLPPPALVDVAAPPEPLVLVVVAAPPALVAPPPPFAPPAPVVVVASVVSVAVAISPVPHAAAPSAAERAHAHFPIVTRPPRARAFATARSARDRP